MTGQCDPSTNQKWGKSHQTVWTVITWGKTIYWYEEDGLVSRPPTLFTSVRRPMHDTSCPKSQLKSLAWPQNLEAFYTMQKRVKKHKMWSVLSNVWFLWFLQSMFLLLYLYQWCGFCWPMMRILLTKLVYAEICDHSLFTLQFCDIEKLTYRPYVVGANVGLCSHNKLATVVPSVLV